MGDRKRWKRARVATAKLNLIRTPVHESNVRLHFFARLLSRLFYLYFLDVCLRLRIIVRGSGDPGSLFFVLVLFLLWFHPL